MMSLRHPIYALWLIASFVMCFLLATPGAIAQEPAPAPADSVESRQAEENLGDAEAEAKPALHLASPRQTMRTFLTAVEDATGDHPERISDAVRCLDFTAIEGEVSAERARPLAHRLYKIIDQIGVRLEDTPDEPPETQTSYVFYPPRAQEGLPAEAEVRFTREPGTEIWLFSSSTIDSIPALEAVVAKLSEPASSPKADVPAARRSPRATVATFLEAMNADPKDLAQAVLCLNPTGEGSDAWPVRAEDLAHKLKNVMDKIKRVVLTEIPNSPEGPPFVWYTSEAGNIVIARVEEKPAKPDWPYAPQVGEWRFNPRTLDAVYLELEHEEIVEELQQAGVTEDLTFGQRLQKQMPDWLRTEFIYLQVWQWSALVVLGVLGWIIALITPAVATALVRFILHHREIKIDREIQRRAMRTSGTVAAVLFWYLVIRYAQLLQLPPGLLGFLLPVLQFVFALTAIWLGYRVVDVIGGHIACNAEIRLTQFDEVLIPLLSKILRIVVIVVVIIFVIEWWDKDWTAVLGALGIGGLALAFAAQETLGNFFGSITVLFDRPFGIGDWIVIGDVDGTVERVGFRSTRVRTFYNSIVTIPNSKIVNTQVDNYGVRRFRRAKTMLSLTYSTPPEKIDEFCEGIRELIRLHPYTRKDYYHVYFNQFASSSLDILLYVFFDTPDWATELRERHRLFVDILRLAHRIGVEFAYPTQTVWLQRAKGGIGPSEPGLAVPAPDEMEGVGADAAGKVFEEFYGSSASHRPPVTIEPTPRSRRSDRDKGGPC